jgi:hypothetical protein
MQLQGANLHLANANLEITVGFLYTLSGSCNLSMKNSKVVIGNHFSHEAGLRRLENVCLTVGTDLIHRNSIGVQDTLINVTADLGGSFTNYFGGNIHLLDCRIRLQTGDFTNAANNSISGKNLILLLEHGNILNHGNWLLPVSQFCIAGTHNVPIQYLPGSEDCVNIANAFSFCNPSNVGGTILNNNGETNFTDKVAAKLLSGPSQNSHALRTSRGFIYNGMLQQTGNQAMVDWILVELRDADNPARIQGFATAILKRNGEIVSEEGNLVLLFDGLPEGNYYVAVRHRNHLGTMTDQPVFLSSVTPLTVDFTDPSTRVKGDPNAGRVYLGKRMLWGGDYNLDGQVIYQGPNNDVFSLFSRVLSENGNTAYLANYIVQGYEMQDFNLDGKVIYQGPNNDRASLLYNSVLAHGSNTSLLANFILLDLLP